MKALQFTVSVPRYLFGKAMGAIAAEGFLSTLGPLQYREVPEPQLLGPDWVKIRTRYGGICGSDLGLVRLHSSPSLSPFGGQVFTIGHEQVGTIVERGENVTEFQVGQRVTADPVLPCPTRGIDPPCRYCQAGEWSRCEHFADGDLGPGLLIGDCADTGGSWSPYYLAHRFQLFAVPDEVSDECAILTDALAVALHPVARTLPGDGETALVVGAGTIGICTVAALRALGSRARIVVLARYRFQGELAGQYGADEVVYTAAGDAYARVAELTGARLYRPVLGKRVMIGGADVVYECVGSDESIDDALRFARAGGRVVILGLASRTKKVDWTPIWSRELRVEGTFATASNEVYQGQTVRPYALALRFMAEGGLDLAPLLTHTFRLEEYPRALSTAMHKGQNRLLKAAFVFDR
jgi:threonine dehydrogenase-like Zn-dependent dehydrogenase